MTRYNDSSSDCSRWSTAKLFRELRKTANLESFSVGHNDIAATFRVGWHEQVNKDQPKVDDFVRDQTRIYRDSYMNPIIAVLEQRFNVPKSDASPFNMIMVRIIKCSSDGSRSTGVFVQAMNGDTPYNAFGPSVTFAHADEATKAITDHNQKNPDKPFRIALD